MPYTTPVVSYSATIDGTYTALTGVQSAVITRGRQRFQDPPQPLSLSLELIPATSYALPLARGQFIDVRATSSLIVPSAHSVPVTTELQPAPIDSESVAILNKNWLDALVSITSSVRKS